MEKELLCLKHKEASGDRFLCSGQATVKRLNRSLIALGLRVCRVSSSWLTCFISLRLLNKKKKKTEWRQRKLTSLNKYLQSLKKVSIHRHICPFPLSCITDKWANRRMSTAERASSAEQVNWKVWRVYERMAKQPFTSISCNSLCLPWTAITASLLSHNLIPHHFLDVETQKLTISRSVTNW